MPSAENYYDYYDDEFTLNQGVSKKAIGDKVVLKDKADRATVEQVLDPRTRAILGKMLSNGTMSRIDGCIATGKEANVYHAVSEHEGRKHIAIKIYKTSILVFKDRDRYVAGEYRFRHGYSRHNPRKMVKVWAEKEMRNLRRLKLHGIPCPEAIQLKLHVLLMGFIGNEDGWAAPRLKDFKTENSEDYFFLYLQCCMVLWKMYNRCKLVHADLSEYNLLVKDNILYVIDVSQSVEHDHPHALEFLRKDCSNVVDFFKKLIPDDKSVLTLRELFEFVVSDEVQIAEQYYQLNKEHHPWYKSKIDGNRDLDNSELILGAEQMVFSYLSQFLESIKDRKIDYADANVQIEEEVFKQLFIPRTLDEVDPADVERDVAKIKKGEAKDLIYNRVVGLPQELNEAIEELTINDDDLSSIGSDEFDEEIEKMLKEMRKARGGTVQHKGDDSDDESINDDLIQNCKYSDSEADDSDGTLVDEEDDEEEEEGNESNEDSNDGERRPRNGRLMKKEEDKDGKKLRKQQAKESKREKRLMKVPKSVKKRKEKLAARRRSHK